MEEDTAGASQSSESPTCRIGEAVINPLTGIGVTIVDSIDTVAKKPNATSLGAISLLLRTCIPIEICCLAF